MRLEREVCERARLSRDARFDGRFYIGVLTTGIYCRPVCPVKAPLAKNIRFFPTAAAAADAGLRPCLRCRPELSAGTPDLTPSCATVERALRLIAEGEAQEGGVARLSEILDITPRHLNRLFHDHVGASPLAVIRTRRLHFAKRLIDETELSMATIAFSAGFGSLRRFNATFRELYDRTPTELRRLRRASGGQTDGERGVPAGTGTDDAPGRPDRGFRFRLAYRPPFDWPRLLDYLRIRATPGVEEITRSSYRRTCRWGRQSGGLAVVHVPEIHSLELRVSPEGGEHLLETVERVRRLFDLNVESATIAARLGRDELLRPLVKQNPGPRVPGAWDGFELAIRAILGQQVTVKGASTLCGRLATAFGDRLPRPCGELTCVFPSPETVSRAELETIGVPKSRARALRALAAATASGEIRFDSTSEPEETRARLIELPGIGPWTAHYISIRALGDPDALPESDLGLLKAVSGEGKRMTPTELRARAEPWRPWRSYASILLWQAESVAPPSSTRP